MRFPGAAGPPGYRFLHHAVDDHSRVVSSEIIDDERKEPAALYDSEQTREATYRD